MSGRSNPALRRSAAMESRRPELSIVVPCFNEEEGISLVVSAFSSLADRLPPFEVVFVNDGSTDRTEAAIRAIGSSEPSPPFEIRLVNLTRNFGHQRALLAGMKAARGRACVSIDADLQDPPENIIEMVRLWREGAEVVLGQRVERNSDSFFKRTSAHLFYRIMTSVTKGRFPEHVADFRLLDEKVLNILRDIRDQAPYWRGLVAWSGHRTAIVRYSRRPRVTGTTKYPISKMVAFAFDAIFGFSRQPLRLVSWLGFIISSLSFAFGLVYVVLRILGHDFVPGWTALLGLMTLLGGIQLSSLGVIGEYIGRIYEQVLERPQVLAYPPEVILSKRSH